MRLKRWVTAYQHSTQLILVLCSLILSMLATTTGYSWRFEILKKFVFRAFDFANHFIEWTIDYDIDEAPFYKIQTENFPENDQVSFKIILLNKQLL